MTKCHFSPPRPPSPSVRLKRDTIDTKSSVCSFINLLSEQCYCCIHLKPTVPLFISKQKTGHLIKCKLILAVGACVSFVLTSRNRATSLVIISCRLCTIKHISVMSKPLLCMEKSLEVIEAADCLPYNVCCQWSAKIYTNASGEQ